MILPLFTDENSRGRLPVTGPVPAELFLFRNTSGVWRICRGDACRRYVPGTNLLDLDDILQYVVERGRGAVRVFDIAVFEIDRVGWIFRIDTLQSRWVWTLSGAAEGFRTISVL